MGVNEAIMEAMDGEVPYQDYLYPPLDELPSQLESTKQKADILGTLAWNGKSVLDVGCANGSLSLILSNLGAKVTGIDTNTKAIQAAIIAGIYCQSSASFIVEDVQHIITLGHRYDIIIFMSVWKHIRYHKGSGVANEILRNLGEMCSTLIFEAGLHDAATDLGSPISRTQVPRLLCNYTSFPNLELAGYFVDNLSIRRDIWKAWR